VQDADLAELNQWAPQLLAKFRTLAPLADVATDQQTSAGTVTLTIDRDQASRFGIAPQLIDDTLYDAFGQREVAQYFTQLNSYFVILEVPPAQQGVPATLDRNSSDLAGHRPAGAAVDLRQIHHRGRSISCRFNHQGPFPAVTLSFNLKPGYALGQAGRGDPAGQGRDRRARDLDRRLPGQTPRRSSPRSPPSRI